MRLAGHCVRHPELAVSPLVLWEPIDGIRNKGRRRRTSFVDQLKKDATQQENIQAYDADAGPGCVEDVHQSFPEKASAENILWLN